VEDGICRRPAAKRHCGGGIRVRPPAAVVKNYRTLEGQGTRGRPTEKSTSQSQGAKRARETRADRIAEHGTGVAADLAQSDKWEDRNLAKQVLEFVNNHAP